MKSKKVIIAGGGTGGHLYPGICLARRLRDAGVEPLFAVKNCDRAIPILKNENFARFTLKVIGLPRKPSLRIILFAFEALFAAIKSVFIIFREKPGAVIGFGGYISFPVVLAARILGVPAVIHEQNFIPGLSNRILARIADKVAVSFPGSEKFWDRKKVVLTGNPVRPELKGISREKALKEIEMLGSEAELSAGVFTVLIFGGSQGASAINTGFTSCLKELEGLRNKIQFIHVSGEYDFCWVGKIYESKKYRAAVFPYIHKMGFAYAAADIVISRAGATTIAELISLKKPAILVPFARAAGNHQEFNARFLSDRGAAITILEKDFECAAILSLLTGMLNDPSRIESIRASLKSINVEESGSSLAKIVTDLLY